MVSLIPRALEGHDSAVERSDAEAVGSATYRKLYKKREPIYPKAVSGTYRQIKWTFMAVLLGVYYVLPWVRWDRGEGRPDQAILVDFANRRFYFGPLELWPQEVFFITGLLVMSALGLFLFTSLFGRVWCGYACPQTVWTDLYLFVERRIEGDRSAQIRLAKQGWTFDKVAKKLVKHAIWIVIAAATGGAWVFYFADAPTLTREIFTGEASLGVYLFIGLLTFTTYALAGTMREQVCTYMCPWPRIQAAMIDQDALTVTYRRDRGEPRGAHKKGSSWQGRGDCVDCNQCVAACPQGIDIRQGLQLECINCALCIDACDGVMAKVGRPKGLIAYDTDKNIERRAAGRAERYRYIRPRTILYGVLLTIAAGLMLIGLINRPTMTLNVIRDRNPAFVRLSDGSIRNGYWIKVLNMRPIDREIRISVPDAPNAVLKTVGAEIEGRQVVMKAPGDKVSQVHVFVTLAPEESQQHMRTITFRLDDPATGLSVVNETTFLTGAKR